MFLVLHFLTGRRDVVLSFATLSQFVNAPWCEWHRDGYLGCCQPTLNRLFPSIIAQSRAKPVEKPSSVIFVRPSSDEFGHVAAFSTAHARVQ